MNISFIKINYIKGNKHRIVKLISTFCNTFPFFLLYRWWYFIMPFSFRQGMKKSCFWSKLCEQEWLRSYQLNYCLTPISSTHPTRSNRKGMWWVCHLGSYIWWGLGGPFLLWHPCCGIFFLPHPRWGWLYCF